MIRLKFALLAGILVLAAGCTTPQPELPRLLEKIDKAYTPGVEPGTIKTEIAHATVKQDKTVGKLTYKLKIPDKIRMQLVIPDETVIKGYNGKTAWEYSTKNGLRVLKGKELDEAKLQATLLFPVIKMEKVFSDIKIAGEAKALDKPCWKLICLPKSEYKSQPITFYVDKKTYLVIKMDELVDTDNGTIPVTTYLQNYQNIGGIMSPMLVNIFSENHLTEIKFVDIIWNAPIDDLDFDLPKSDF